MLHLNQMCMFICVANINAFTAVLSFIVKYAIFCEQNEMIWSVYSNALNVECAFQQDIWRFETYMRFI